jgi:hypothetical protein
MNNGVCPKCNASEVYCGPAAEGEGLTVGSYTSQVEVMNGDRRATLWVDTYICGACGYLEMHVANRADLPVLAQADGWVKIGENN